MLTDSEKPISTSSGNEKPDVPMPWKLVNETVGDNVRTVTLEIFDGQDAKTYEIYYKGGRTGGKPATPPDVFLDLTKDGKMVPPKLLAAGETRTVNGTRIALRTSHGQAVAEGTCTYLTT